MSETSTGTKLNRVISALLWGGLAWGAIIVAIAVTIANLPPLYTSTTTVEGQPSTAPENYRIPDETLMAIVEYGDWDQRWGIPKEKAKEKIQNSFTLSPGKATSTIASFTTENPADSQYLAKDWCNYSVALGKESKAEDTGSILRNQTNLNSLNLEIRDLQDQIEQISIKEAEHPKPPFGMEPIPASNKKTEKLFEEFDSKINERHELEAILKATADLYGQSVIEEANHSRDPNIIPRAAPITTTGHILGFTIFSVILFKKLKKIDSPPSSKELRQETPIDFDY